MKVSSCYYIKLRPEETGMFRFLLESYENLAIATTLDRSNAIIKVRFAEENRRMVEEALKDISRSIALAIIPVNSGVKQNG